MNKQEQALKDIEFLRRLKRELKFSKEFRSDDFDTALNRIEMGLEQKSIRQEIIEKLEKAKENLGISDMDMLSIHNELNSIIQFIAEPIDVSVEEIFEKYGVQIVDGGIKWMRKEDFAKAIAEYVSTNVKVPYKPIVSSNQPTQSNTEAMRVNAKRLRILESSIQGSLDGIELFGNDADVIEKSNVIEMLKDFLATLKQ